VTGRPVHDLACREFVALVTAYLDDHVSTARRAQIDDHLALCEGCRTVLVQWRTVSDLAGRLTSADFARAGDESAPIRRSELSEEWIQRRCPWLH
jgi:anti-sigma factor RsiW